MDYLSLSISRMIMITFIVALLLPLAFLLPSLDKNIWKDVHKDNLVKHQLLATSLVEPIKLHISSYENDLKSLGNALLETGLKENKKAVTLMDRFVNSSENMDAVSLILSDDKSQIHQHKEFINTNSRQKCKSRFS